MNINLFPEKALIKTVTKSGLHIVIYLNRVSLNQLFRYVMKLLPPHIQPIYWYSSLYLYFQCVQSIKNTR